MWLLTLILYMKYECFTSVFHQNSINHIPELFLTGLYIISTERVLFLFQSIRVLRRPEYKPFVIFVKSPSYERLKETRCTLKSKFTQDEKNPRTFTVSTYRHKRHLILFVGSWKNNYNEVTPAYRRSGRIGIPNTFGIQVS